MKKATRRWLFFYDPLPWVHITYRYETSVIPRRIIQLYRYHVIGSMSFTYTNDAHTQLARFLTTERLTSYLIASKGDMAKAIKLYEKNTRLSEALYGVLQGCEVALRNTIHERLRTGFARADWYEIPKLLHGKEAVMLGRAKMSVQAFGRSVKPGQIVAELTMGFWIRLLSPEYEKAIWVQHAYKAFPHFPKPSRVTIFNRFDEIRRLRNRVAHHEPILSLNGIREYEKIMEAVSWICPVTSAWIDSHNNYPRLVNFLA